MGDFSRDTFNRLKRYVSVRLQQGVPVLDADWNELQDIRKFELEAFLKRFVGNGVPAGNDGFAISSTAAADDFLIADGHCLVEGWDVVNDWTEAHEGEALTYTSQRLLRNDELVGWELADLPELDTPTSDRTDTVYLDAWEREVDSTEDDNIVNPNIGIETCVRIKREWVVRVAKGATKEGLPKPPPEHVYYPLATLYWRVEPDGIVIDDVIDLRRTNVTLGTNNDLQQSVTDAFGADYTLDGDGQPNLKISLRKAINSMILDQGFLVGDLPGAAIRSLPSSTSVETRVAVLSHTNDEIWVFWASSGVGIQCNSYNPVSAVWGTEFQLTNYPAVSYPVAFQDSTGSVWVFWGSYALEGTSLVHKCTTGPHDGTWTTSGQIPFVNNYAGDFYAFEGRPGNIWLFWGISNQIWYNYYDGNAWKDTHINLVTGVARLFAFVDSKKMVWVLWRASINAPEPGIWYKYHDGVSWIGPQRLSEDVEPLIPVAVEDSTGNIWAFWYYSSTDILCKRYHRQGNDHWDANPTGLNISGANDLFAMPGATGDVWIFWSSGSSTTVGNIYYKRYSAKNGWGPAVVVAAGGKYHSPRGFMDQEENIWLFWGVFDDAEDHTLYRKLIWKI